jgi:putative Ca2+/H+ antiporter (TMEM165/GDT1 family)
VVLGDNVTRLVSEQTLKIAAGVAFIGMGVWTLISARG